MKISTHPKWLTWIFTAIFGIIFILLLSYRLNLFQYTPSKPQRLKTRITEKESWMNIFQTGQKIGYAHRRLIPYSGGYHLYESTRMRLNTMAMIQDIHFQITGELQPDYTVASFVFDINSSQFDFHMSGKRDGDIVRVLFENKQIQIPVGEGLFLSSGALETVLNSITEVNQESSFSVFDPLTMNTHPVRILMTGYETLEVMGHIQKVRKVSMEWMGLSQTAWIGNDGNILQEEGPLGLRLQQTTEKDALRNQLSSSTDLTEMISVPSNVVLKSPIRLNRIRIKITGIPKSIDLNEGRQQQEGQILTINREILPETFESTDGIDPEFIEPTPFIQSDHPRIREQVAKIVQPADSPLTKARKIMEWIYSHIEKRPVLSVPSALETLSHLMGDCNEHAVLFAAMLRAAGIPAQVEIGLMYSKGRFYYHAWNRFFCGTWITADSTMNQLPADVTHICISRGDPIQRTDWISIIGKITLEILEPET